MFATIFTRFAVGPQFMGKVSGQASGGEFLCPDGPFEQNIPNPTIDRCQS
jgi:hypothetical protein